jgi:hypothetical protein
MTKTSVIVINNKQLISNDLTYFYCFTIVNISSNKQIVATSFDLK